MDEVSEVKPLERLWVHDVLLDYDLKMVERGFSYPPNFTGSTNEIGLWVGEVPYEITRLRLVSVKDDTVAYIYPKTLQLVRCTAKLEVLSTETIQADVRIIRRANPLLSIVPRINFNGIKD